MKMKKKELLALGLFGAVLAVVAIVVLNSTSSGQSKKRSAQIEVVPTISADYDQTARDIVLDRNSQYPVETFLPPINASQNLDNKAPFRPN